VYHGFDSRFLAQGSSGAITCPMELYGLWVKQISHGGIAIMISHQGMCISSKTSHDKADIVRM
jgi:hypothetical protein